jgi:8-oxo-dGTP diphosphatase
MLSRVVVAVDVAAFALADGELRVLLVRRGAEPFAGRWGLPGGAHLEREGLGAAAERILVERTGLRGVFLEQLYTFGDPNRDPRGRTISVAYYALLREPIEPRPGRDVLAAGWQPANLPEEVLPLAFDHDRVVAYARWRLAQKVTYTPLAFRVLPERFTLADLRAVVETIEGRRYDPSNFAKQMLARWDLAPLPGIRDRRSRRPARLFRYIGPGEIVGTPDSIIGGEDTLPSRAT